MITRSILFSMYICLASIAPSTLFDSAGFDDLDDPPPEFTRFARKAVRDLLKADDANLIRYLPKRWEKMKASDRKDILILCLRRFDSTKPAPLHNWRNLVVPDRADSPERMKQFGGEGGWLVFQDITYENGRCAWAVEQLLTKDTRVGFNLFLRPCDRNPEDEKLPPNDRPFRAKTGIFTEKLNKSREVLDKTVLVSYQAAIQQMDLPRGRGLRSLPDEKIDMDAPYRLSALLDETDYYRLRAMPKEWSGLMSEEAQKCLIIKLLEKLDDPTELADLENAHDVFVLSRLLETERENFSPEGEMLEQDIHVVNGRCAWALEKLLKTTLPSFDAKIVKDKKKLKESIREAHLRVIEAMKMPEQPWVKAYKDED